MLNFLYDACGDMTGYIIIHRVNRIEEETDHGYRGQDIL